MTISTEPPPSPIIAPDERPLFLADAECLARLQMLASELGCIAGRCHLYQGAEPELLLQAALRVTFRAALTAAPLGHREGASKLASEAARYVVFYADLSRETN